MSEETNSCDKCGIELLTDELIWITADGFRPKPNEIVPESLYPKFDALCEGCYLEEITLKTVL